MPDSRRTHAPGEPPDQAPSAGTLHDGADLRSRMRSREWVAHPLGEVSAWPESLKAALDAILASRCPMWMGWGPELFFFCNDACLPLLPGGNRAKSGLPAREAWGGEWNDIRPHAESVIATGRPVASERALRCSGADDAPLTLFYNPVLDESRAIAGVVCIITEASTPIPTHEGPPAGQNGSLRASASLTASAGDGETRATAAALEDSERRYRDLVEGLPVALYTCDARGRILLFNDEAAALWGRRPEIGVDEWCGSWRIFRADGSPVPLDQCLMAVTVREGRAVRGEEIIIERPDGARRHVLPHPAPLRNATGEITGAVNLLIDITDRRETEAALRDTEERLRLATQMGKLGVWDWDIAANRVSWTESLYAIHGVGRDGFDGTVESFSALVHPEERARVSAAIEAALNGADYEIEFRALGPDGATVWLFTTGIVLRKEGKPVRMLGATMDVTERRRALDAVTESERRFSRFMQHLPGLAWIKDEHGRYVFANGAAVRVFGLPASELLGRTDTELFPPETAAQFQRNDRLALAGEGGEQTVETLRHHEDGRLHHSIVSKFPIPSGEGRPPFVGGMAIDVTDRREAEIALQEAHDRLEQRVRERTAELEQANARFQAMFDQGLFAGLIALDGTLIDINRSWLEATGFTREHVLGRPFWEAEWWTPSPDVQAWIKSGFTAAARGERVHGETPCYLADGSERLVDFAFMPIRDSAGEVSFVFPTGLDVTDRHRAQEDLRAAQVMRESEQRFRSMADCAPVLIWMSDVANACTWFNQQWLDFVGRPMEREIGNGWVENVHKDDLERFRRSRDSAFAARQPFETEFRMRRHDGEYRWMFDRGVPAFGPSGAFSGYIGSCIDITERKQAELAIQRLAAIVESSEDAIVGKDLSGMVTSWNRGAERMFGYTAAEMIGQPITVLIPPDRAGEEAGILARLRRGMPIELFETRRCRKDGTVLDVSLSISPIRDASGAIVGASKIARDITASKRAEIELRRREQLYRAIGESIDYGVWVCDAAGRNTYASDSFLRLLGITQDQCSGLDWTEKLHPDDAAATAAAWMKCVSMGERWEREHRFRGVDGRWHPILARGVPVRDERGEITSWVGINLDISRLKENELALERTRDDALAASRAKDDFLAALSHELRTPLNPVLLLASEAAENETLAPEVRADFAAIRKNASLEARLIDDLLDLTRISRGKLQLEMAEHSLHDILRDALSTVQTDAEEKRIGITVRLGARDPRVMCDTVRLQQVFWNVLKNAVKFTPEGGTITVSTRSRPEEKTVKVSIADTGIGMTAREIARVFDAFIQGDHAGEGGSHQFGGLGLGLAISRMVVERHAGSIDAVSPGPGLGSTFDIVLPLARTARSIRNVETPVAALADDPSAAAAPDRRDALRILLVEDHAPTRVALERLLVRRKFQVDAASTLAEARASAAKATYDILVSDIGLPDGSGHDLMREMGTSSAIKGIALTGYGMEQDLARSRSAGFSAHLTKPVAVAALDRALAEIMAQSAPDA